MSSSEMAPVRIGILGAGGVVESLHLPVLETFSNARVAWLCDKQFDRAKGLARRFRVPETFERIADCSPVDAVLIAIPVGYRAEALTWCFKNGWDAFCEKPFAPTLEEFDAWLSAAKAAGNHVGVGLMRRFYRSTRLATALLRQGVFGKILEVVAGEGGHMRGTGQPENWYQSNRAAAGGGVLIETGAHLLDQALGIVGATGVELRAYEAEATDGIERHVQLSASFSTAKQKSVPVRFHLSRAHDVVNGIFVRCASATLALGTTPASQVSILDPEGETLANLEGASGATTSYQAFRMEWEAFLGQRLSAEASDLDVGRARLSMELIDRCYRSVAPATPASVAS